MFLRGNRTSRTSCAVVVVVDLSTSRSTLVLLADTQLLRPGSVRTLQTPLNSVSIAGEEGDREEGSFWEDDIGSMDKRCTLRV